MSDGWPTPDGTHGPNDWNLDWMVYGNHFNSDPISHKMHSDDTLDDSGAEPLIAVSHFDVNGRSASRHYD